jgi:hypothetical protein
MTQEEYARHVWETSPGIREQYIRAGYTKPPKNIFNPEPTPEQIREQKRVWRNFLRRLRREEAARAR